MKNYQLVIFDWDGTVMDSAAKIIRCMQNAARHCEVPVPTDDEVAHIIGISLKPAIMQLFNTRDEALADRIVQAYKTEYLQQDVVPCPLFTGAEKLFDALRAANKTLAVATGKARRGLNRAWSNTGTGHYFATSRCADEANSKPSPDMLVQILEELNVSAADAVMIGDTVYDMQMAEAIGMDRIGVSYGVHAQVNLEKHKPEAIVHSLAELGELLLPASAGQ
ncbi:HAD-IA family hydrolase [Alteromonas sp. ASW11-19]|uniref:HAD-IA family hydrolase n=1 Tax=Alteromonas salexigens TaxID=2982530 RepID=A0ABT2VKX7_9ALTE|nr:HAD-IA family hydrolase [Alteromonas salexigens]MCU7553955.1 HAD-IA family hydrolase [Alteromonas salexigens]